MERWAKAATCGSGARVPLMAQTARCPRIACSAVATGPPRRSAWAPRAGSSAARRPRETTAVFVSRVSPNPRLTHCFSWPERGGCFGSAGRLPFDLWPFARLPVVRWKTRHGPTSRKVNQSPAATSCLVDAVFQRRRLTDIMRRKGGRCVSPPSCAVVRRRQGLAAGDRPLLR